MCFITSSIKRPEIKLKIIKCMYSTPRYSNASIEGTATKTRASGAVA